jgi:hypothetical protein
MSEDLSYYPDQTEGTKIAAETRARCNNLTRLEREKLFNQAMVMIYGGKQQVELERKAAAYPRMVDALKRHVALIPDKETNELLKELGELE